MQNILARFLKDESGATAIEYGLIAALISVGIITGATSLGTSINATFTTIADQDGRSASTVYRSTGRSQDRPTGYQILSSR